MRKFASKKSMLAVAFGAIAFCAPSFVSAVTLTPSYIDGASEGFNETDLYSAGVTLGDKRREAFEFALGIWSDLLQGPNNVTIVVEAEMDPLGSNVLGAASPISFHSPVPNGLSNTIYGSALGKAIAGSDRNGSDAEIGTVYSYDTNWNLESGSNPSFSQFDLITVALHEIGHGLNFLDLIDSGSGAWIFGTPGIYGRNLSHFNGTDYTLFTTMNNSTRRTRLTSAAVYWFGNDIQDYWGEPAEIFAPITYINGSSISHWENNFVPPQLMEFSISNGTRLLDVGLTADAMMDMGWTFAPTSNPRSGFVRTANGLERLFTMDEGDSIQTDVVLDYPTASELTIPLTVTGISGTPATPGSDLTVSPNPVVISAGQRSATITVIAASDAEVGEGQERARISLGTPSSGSVDVTNGANSIEIRINNQIPAGPTVAVNQAAGQDDPTNGSTINFTAVFSEDVTGFGDSAADVNIFGTAGADTAVVTGSGNTYNIAVSGMDSEGSVIVELPAGAAVGTTGLMGPSEASNSTDNTVTYDTTSPGVADMSVQGLAGGSTSDFPILIEVTFEEPVNGFTDANVDLSGSTVIGTPIVSVINPTRRGEAGPYTIQIGGTFTGGDITVDLIETGVTDDAGNPADFSGFTPVTFTWINAAAGAEGSWDKY